MDKRFTESYIEELAHKYKTGTLTPEEQVDFDAWYRNHDDSQFPHSDAQNAQMIKDRLLANILAQTHPQPRHRLVKLWPRIAVAASILLAISAGGYFLLHKQPAANQQVAQTPIKDIAPGRNQATLTLANGKQIVISKALRGQIAVQGNTTINANDAIIYTAAQASNEITYNTMRTARGEQSPYVLVLADGSKVWLNAASSITFPAAFNGKVRKVKITGEVYFEVKHNATQPFEVEAKGQTIEDIGTAFNVNAYDDEPAIKTTLISGSVRINHTTTLIPGQMAVQRGDALTVKHVDTEGAIAWKNGYFLFDHEDPLSIMRKISRWYDVDIEYPQGKDIGQGFFGSITRYSNVSQVLSMLQETGPVKFRIEGRKIIVTKK